MATMPPQAQPMAGDPDAMDEGAEAGATADTDDAGKTSLCIDVDDASGAITFEIEKGGQPGKPQPCADIGQALKMALQAYQQLNSGGQGDQAAAQSQFDVGFRGGRGGQAPQPAKPTGGY